MKMMKTEVIPIPINPKRFPKNVIDLRENSIIRIDLRPNRKTRNGIDPDGRKLKIPWLL